MTTDRLEQLLRERMGLVVDTIGRRALHHALATRQTARNLPGRDDYLQLVIADRQEWDELLELLVVPETWFFRGQAAFEHLVKVARRESTSDRAVSLRVLSAPCSTGEEPYSIVMALTEDGWSPERLTVHAVDLSRRALEHAETAEYSPRSFREITPLAKTCQERYFTRVGSRYRLDPRIRNATKFWHGNLTARDWTTDGAPYDIVFCRNMLIYLDDDSRRIAVDNVCRLLRPSGVVFAGHAEPLNRIDGRLEAMPPTEAFAFRRSAGVASSRLDGKDHSPARSPWHKPSTHLPASSSRPRAAPPTAPPATSAAQAITGQASGGQASGGRASGGQAVSGRTASGRAIGGSKVGAATVGGEAVGGARELPVGEPTVERPRAGTTPVRIGTTPSSPDDILTRAKQAANRGDMDASARLCHEYLAASPSSAVGHCLLGVVLQSQGKSADARVQFERAVYLDPDNVEALTHLMLDARRTGDNVGESNYRRRLERIGQRSAGRGTDKGAGR